jgi:hypothetical protein
VLVDCILGHTWLSIHCYTALSQKRGNTREEVGKGASLFRHQSFGMTIQLIVHPMNGINTLSRLASGEVAGRHPWLHVHTHIHAAPANGTDIPTFGCSLSKRQRADGSHH